MVVSPEDEACVSMKINIGFKPVFRLHSSESTRRSAQREGELMNNPRILLNLGLILLFTGWIIPLLMIMHIIPSTFFLNFVAWGASVSGLFLGFIGVATWTKLRKQ